MDGYERYAQTIRETIHRDLIQASGDSDESAPHRDEPDIGECRWQQRDAISHGCTVGSPQAGSGH